MEAFMDYLEVISEVGRRDNHNNGKTVIGVNLMDEIISLIKKAQAGDKKSLWNYSRKKQRINMEYSKINLITGIQIKMTYFNSVL